jgi:two-component system, cell cycle response regulator
VRVVVVDPSRTVLKAVSRLLESAGHGVAAFVDAREAFDYIKSDREVSALLASAQLNSMSGLELCWETRLLSGRERPIYIILMSSNSDQQHLINALDSGADEFIRKPPVGEELYARLRSAERLLRLQNELIELASIDPLTHVFNRRAFFDRAQLLCRGASPLAAIMLDVDHFKRINDTYGHDVGDQVLGAIGREFQSENAVVGRLGGEEFAILIGGASGEAAVEHAEFLRARVAALWFDVAGEKASVTCSLGVAERRPGESIDQLLRRADTALYEAKSSGRDRVVEARAVLDSGEGRVPHLVRTARRGTEDGDKPQAALSQSRLLTGQPSAGEEKAFPDGNASRSAAGLAFVLDDEPQIGAIVSKVLQTCGFAPRQFTSPSPFLAAFRDSVPGLVVLDLSLGQSDAVEVIHQLEAGKYQGKVLLISGRDETTLNEITRIGEKHGLKMLPPLKKPFRPADLKQRLSTGQAANAALPAPPDCETRSGVSSQAVVPLGEALRNNWLEVWYQPKFDLKSSSICGAEALIRARHPLRGVITPDGLLPPPGDPDYEALTRFVVERAAADWKRFAEQGSVLKLPINAPVSVIDSPTFITLIRSLRPDDPRFPGLTIEVTEDELVHDSARAREIANQLKLYDVDLSIDDFGAGYASLSRLNDFPFVEVKIDRSFVSGCAASKIKHSLCETVVDLAHRFGAKVCAEGVETVDDLRAVKAMQCDTAQGFLLAKPMRAAAFASMLAAGPDNAQLGLLEASAGKEPGGARSGQAPCA